MLKSRLSASFSAVAFLLIGCSSGGESGEASPRGSRNLITAEEIAASPGSFTDAFNVVESLRPQWLQARSSTSDGVPILPVVYVGSMRRGGLQALRQLRADAVQEIRYINARDATTRWGGSVGAGGVIQVTQKS